MKHRVKLDGTASDARLWLFIDDDSDKIEIRVLETLSGEEETLTFDAGAFGARELGEALCRLAAKHGYGPALVKP